MVDVFRPRTEPASILYDAFQEEAEKREGRTVEAWQRCEHREVWYAAYCYAKKHYLLAPTLEQVKEAAMSASGHIDFGSKWAYAVVRIMEGN